MSRPAPYRSIAAILCLCLATTGLGPVLAQQGPPATMVEVVEARRGPLSTTITAVGTLQADESVIIRPEVAGRVSEILFKEGEAVTAGAVLLRLDDSIERAEVAQAEADIALSRSNYERSLDLFRKGSASARSRDEALAQLQTDTARLALAEAKLAKASIVAPFGGLLGLRRVSLGDYVTPGQAIVNLEDVDPVKVDFRVPETFLGQLRRGQSIRVEVDAFPGRAFKGEVYALDPRIDQEGRSVALRARIANPDGRLRPGLFARVTLVTQEKADALLIPEQAVFARGADNFVYVVRDGKASLTPIRLGQRQGAEVEVIEGLEAGAQVVSAGHLKLRDGAAVKLAAAPGS